MTAQNPDESGVSAIPLEQLDRYGPVVLRVSTKKTPHPSPIPFTKAIILVDRKWREIHGKKIMPAVHRPDCYIKGDAWIIIRDDNGEKLARVDSKMVQIGWTMALAKIKGKDEEVMKKHTVYSQENHAHLEETA